VQRLVVAKNQPAHAPSEDDSENPPDDGIHYWQVVEEVGEWLRFGRMRILRTNEIIPSEST